MKLIIDTEVLKCLFEGNIEKDINKVINKIIPDNRSPLRKSIDLERVVVRERVLALFDVDVSRYEGDRKKLSACIKELLNSTRPPLPVLTTIKQACASCPAEHLEVSNICQGCFARPCTTNCPKDAIYFKNGKAMIDQSKCIKCNKCLERCPYHSIVRSCIPCENACPVGAIKQNENGVSQVDHTKCIACGRCIASCPFGAVVPRSSLISVANLIKNKQKTVAIIAPAIVGQFNASLEKIKKAIKEVGFTEVIEVAEGAEITSINEAKELMERKENNEGYLLTSCCPAWVMLVEKHIPLLKEHISKTLSPMGYTIELAEKRFPGYKIIFVGPCIAKREEAAVKYPNRVHSVITYEELSAIFKAKNIDFLNISESPEDWDKCKSFDDCRDFALKTGVAECVLNRVDDRNKYKVLSFSGIDKKLFMQMKIWPKLPPDADIIEIMACPDGCISGPGTIVNPQNAIRFRDSEKKRLDSEKTKSTNNECSK